MPRVVPLVIALVALQAALVLLFVAPAHTPEPHDLPVGIAGPAEAVTTVQRALESRGDAFDVHVYANAAQARQAIREREVYGALVPAEGRLLVASAASPAVAQLMRDQLAAGAAATPPAQGTTALDPPAGTAGIEVEDVVPLAEGDPRGAVLNLLLLPLMIACFPLAALLVRMRLGAGRTIGAVLAFSALSGLALTALLGAMDALPGPYLAVSAAAALVVAAVALTAAGMMRLLGPAGIAIAAVLFIVIGNPGSGNASAPEMLPGFWRVTGQLLPPGAGGQALRDVAYFDGHGLLVPALVLAGWALFGIALVLLGRWAPKPRAEAAPAPEQPAAVAA